MLICVTEWVACHNVSIIRIKNYGSQRLCHLVEVASPGILKRNTQFQYPVSPLERIALTLRFLAMGKAFFSLKLHFQVSGTARHVLKVCLCAFVCGR